MSTRAEAQRRAKRALELLEQGHSKAEIARMLGCSRQRVYQLTQFYTEYHFKPYTETQVIYPNLRNWLNENKLTRDELIDLMELPRHCKYYNSVRYWLSGRKFPGKYEIDKLLKATGMSYEQLFYREE